MMVFGHIGITLAVALGTRQIVVFNRKQASLEVKEKSSRGSTDGLDGRADPGLAGGLFDIRWWLVGSMLPDIIDKPVGHFLFSQTFGNNGRIFSHTLLFAVVILVIGLYAGIFKKSFQVIALFSGVVMHLILDGMWNSPQTLFWPFLGFDFPKFEEYNWLATMWHTLFTDPSANIPEITGAVLVILFVIILFRQKSVITFLRTGHL